MKSITNKTVIVITGASRGLGRALAEVLTDANNILLLCARSIKELNHICAEIQKKGNECYVYKVDVSKKTEIETFIRTITKKFLKIDILINNAGTIHKGKPMYRITDKEYDLNINTNFGSVFYAMREVIPVMKKRKSGVIVTISSTAGKRGNPDFAIYSASKFAVTGLMQSARELSKYGIRCLTILPAGMNTAMRKYILGAKDAAKRQSPEDVARLIKTAIEKEDEFPSGSEIEIRNGRII